MSDGCDRMIKNHSGAGILHNSFDFFPHLRLIAMDFAVGTESFGFFERAFVTSLPGVFPQPGAGRAKAVISRVMTAAVNSYHLSDNLLFPFHLAFYIFFQHMAPWATLNTLSAIFAVDRR